MSIRNGLADAIGNTPLIRLNHFSELTGCEILGKALRAPSSMTPSAAAGSCPAARSSRARRATPASDSRTFATRAVTSS